MTEADDRCTRFMRLDNVAELSAAQAHLSSIDSRAHALPRMFDRAVEWRARYCFARQRHRKRMSTRESQTGCCLEQIGIQRSSIDNARFRQRQCSSLVEDNSIDARQPLDGIPGAQDHAGAKKCAG